MWILTKGLNGGAGLQSLVALVRVVLVRDPLKRKFFVFVYAEAVEARLASIQGGASDDGEREGKPCRGWQPVAEATDRERNSFLHLTVKLCIAQVRKSLGSHHRVHYWKTRVIELREGKPKTRHNMQQKNS